MVRNESRTVECFARHFDYIQSIEYCSVKSFISIVSLLLLHFLTRCHFHIHIVYSIFIYPFHIYLFLRIIAKKRVVS